MPKVSSKYLIPQFMLAHFSHHVCTGVLIPLLPLLREGFGLNYFQSGVLVSSFSISYGIGQVPSAILADRFSPRIIIMLGLLTISFTSIGVGLTQSFWQMVPFFIAMGLIGGTYHAPASSFISQAVPLNIRGRALGLHVTGGSASFLLTPAMALGIATLFHSWRVPFLVLSIPALLAGIMLWLTTEGTRHDTEDLNNKIENGEIGAHESSPSIEEAKKQISWSQIIKSIGIIACLSMTMQVIFASVGSYLPLFMVDHHGISPRWAGIVISFIAGTGIIGAPAGGSLSDRFGRKKVILLSLSLSGPFFFAITRSPYGIFLLISLLLYGLTISVRMPTMESLIADVVPVGRRTTVMGVYFFMGMETAGLSTPIIGRLIDGFGLDIVFTYLASGLCVVAALALLLRKHL